MNNNQENLILKLVLSNTHKDPIAAVYVEKNVFDVEIGNALGEFNGKPCPINKQTYKLSASKKNFKIAKELNIDENVLTKYKDFGSFGFYVFGENEEKQTSNLNDEVVEEVDFLAFLKRNNF